MLKEKNHLMEVLKRIGLKYKTILDLRNEFQIKSLPNSQKLGDIGCLTLNSRGEKVLNPTSAKCGKGQFGESLFGKGNYFCCGKSGHKVGDFPNIKV